MFENKTMKLVEIFYEVGKDRRRMMEGMNLTKIHCKHICVYDSESSRYNLYVLIKNVKQQQQKVKAGSNRTVLALVVNMGCQFLYFYHCYRYECLFQCTLIT
jgi:uncharacterized protein YktA (UPF0223 family)